MECPFFLFMDYLVIGIIAVVIISLLCGFLKLRGKFSSETPAAVKHTSDTPEPAFSKCPLCSSILEAKYKERIYSKVFRPMTVPDQRCNILGCPHCYPQEKGVKRVCPVCHKHVPESGYLIARLFNKTGMKHVHIIGCTECNRNGSKDI